MLVCCHPFLADVFSVQGWSSVIPSFKPMDFLSLYLEIPLMLVMYSGWLLFSKSASSYSLVGDYSPLLSPTDSTPLLRSDSPLGRPRRRFHDVVDTWEIDLHRDEYEDEDEDFADDVERETRLEGRAGMLWALYYWLL